MPQSTVHNCHHLDLPYVHPSAIYSLNGRLYTKEKSVCSPAFSNYNNNDDEWPVIYAVLCCAMLHCLVVCSSVVVLFVVLLLALFGYFVVHATRGKNHAKILKLCCEQFSSAHEESRFSLLSRQ